jgi:hypothetical protein
MPFPGFPGTFIDGCHYSWGYLLFEVLQFLLIIQHEVSYAVSSCPLMIDSNACTKSVTALLGLYTSALTVHAQC